MLLHRIVCQANILFYSIQFNSIQFYFWFYFSLTTRLVRKMTRWARKRYVPLPLPASPSNANTNIYTLSLSLLWNETNLRKGCPLLVSSVSVPHCCFSILGNDARTIIIVIIVLFSFQCCCCFEHQQAYFKLTSFSTSPKVNQVAAAAW